jgi:flavin reductase (DIM6/NTAB) family NADH-FMN oxidoreductase RutF
MPVEQSTKKDAIGAALGRLPSGVFVVTAKRKNNGEPVGLMSSWVAQAGFEPLAISVAVHPDREIYNVLKETGQFCLNILSTENMSLLKAFSKYNPGQFKDLETRDVLEGVVLKESVAYLSCRVIGDSTVTDHTIFVAEVIDGEYLDHELSPMIHLRKSGYQY